MLFSSVPQKEVRHVLIATVGQTAEPILTAITFHAPEAVVLIASQGSQAIAGRISGEFRGELLIYTVLIDDAESLSQSYTAAQRALERALEWEAMLITADLTGGTKPMVAGLTLALSGRGVTFSYVGGDTRNAQGRVQSGSERVIALEDPTVRYHVREWAAFQSAWNAGRFTEAKTLLERLPGPLSRAHERFYRHLIGLCDALLAWDRFQHEAAAVLLERHLEPALSIAEAWRHGAKVRVLSELEKQAEHLATLSDPTELPTRLLLADLLANAQRRADAGRFDDALARLYRATELAAEVDIAERYGFSLKNPNGWPDTVSPELKRRAGGLLGLKETLDLACDLDIFRSKTGTIAQHLAGDYHSTLRPLLHKRHRSILAHGLQAVGYDDFRGLWTFLESYGFTPALPWPRW